MRKPIITKPFIIRKRIRRKYLWNKIEYYLIWDCSKRGPFINLGDAEYLYEAACCAWLL